MFCLLLFLLHILKKVRQHLKISTRHVHGIHTWQYPNITSRLEFDVAFKFSVGVKLTISGNLPFKIHMIEEKLTSNSVSSYYSRKWSSCGSLKKILINPPSPLSYLCSSMYTLCIANPHDIWTYTNTNIILQLFKIVCIMVHTILFKWQSLDLG